MRNSVALTIVQELFATNLEISLIFAKEKLGEFLVSTEFDRQIKLAFGDNVDIALVENLIKDLSKLDSLIFPEIQIREQSEINGARGGFSSASNTIYLSRDFLTASSENIQEISTVIIEELGHFIDSYLNIYDTPGDEGELFTNLVQGANLSNAELQRIQTENDNTTVVIDGQPIQLEQSTTIFLNLFAPIGITLDNSGNLIVNHDSISNALISKISPDTILLEQVSYGNLFSLQDFGYLATIPSSGEIIQLQRDGDRVLINPNTLALNLISNIKSLDIDSSSVFDIVTGVTRDLGSFILPGAPQTTYGDISILERGSQLDIFVSGLSVGTFPFVMRLRFQSGVFENAKVVAASSGTTAGTANTTRGVAVNNRGTVLTTLPINFGNTGFIDVPVTFSADFPEGAGQFPTIQLRGSMQGKDFIDIASQGITTDPRGNFYVVTNAVGSVALQASSGGSLIVLSPDVNAVLDVQGGQILSSYIDVAVNSNSNLAYITTGGTILATTLNVQGGNSGIWTIIDGADLNKDGYDDVLLANSTGQTGAWTMSNGSVVAYTPLPSITAGSGWEVIGSADTNADGYDDILLRNSDGTHAVWAVSNNTVVGLTPIGFIAPSIDWQAVTGADVNGDGYDDVLLQNPNGSNGYWRVVNNAVAGFNALPYIDPASGWKIVGSADLNGDGFDDILLSNADGSNGAWAMNNGVVTGFAPLPYIAPGTGWNVVGSADLNGNGYDDILLRNSNGANGFWAINNGAVEGFAPLPYTG
jgi:hypothetical protein